MKSKLCVLVALVVAVAAFAADPKPGGDKARPGGDKAKGPKAEPVMGLVENITDAAITVKPMKKDAVAVTVALNADTRYAEVAAGVAADTVKDAAVVVLADGEGDAAVAKGVAVYTGTAKEPVRLAMAALPALGMMVRAKTKPDAGAKQPKPIGGKVTAIEGGKISIQTREGAVAIKLADNVVVAKVSDKTRADITKGRAVSVTAIGEPKAAVLVMQLPEIKHDGADRPKGDKPKGDRPKGDKAKGDAPKGDKPKA